MAAACPLMAPRYRHPQDVRGGFPEPPSPFPDNQNSPNSNRKGGQKHSTKSIQRASEAKPTPQATLGEEIKSLLQHSSVSLHAPGQARGPEQDRQKF